MIEQKEFGYFEGYRCDLITLSNKKGYSVSLTNFGATVVKLFVPDKNGNLGDVVLGYDTLEEYANGNSCFGATIGRFANRIGGAEFTLDNVKYQLDKNDGENTLHSGFYGYHKRVWKIAEVQDGDEPFVQFSYNSPDGEQHMPGNLNINVKFTLCENALKIEYNALSDADTIVNLTNHSYFNLKGEGSGDILSHKAKINAKQYTPVDSALIPTGDIAYITNTPFDFTVEKTIGQDIRSGRLPNGYDHNFILGVPHENRIAAVVSEPTSGRVMTVTTDSPAVQFYIAGGLNNEKGKNSHTYNRFDAFCFETQFAPDSPNKKAFESCVLKAGDTYHFTTVYSFTVDE